MFVLVSDYKEIMEADYSLTKEALREAMGAKAEDLQIVVEPFESQAFERDIRMADGLITAFLPVDQAFLAKASNLKYISINAVGYSNLDLAAVKARGIKVCHIREYCTREVSEHALSMLMTINNGIKLYDMDVSKGHWAYGNVPARPTLNHMKAVIFGFGKIGKSTGRMLKSLGMEVGFVDPYVKDEVVTYENGERQSFQKMTLEQVFDQADVIINHMALTEDNYHLFNYDFFKKCKREPIFINVGRGGCHCEAGLVKALEERLVYAAGLDVLEDENPKLLDNPLVGREDVLLSPHSAFYSKNSMERLHEISGKNMGYLLCGEYEKLDESI